MRRSSELSYDFTLPAPLEAAFALFSQPHRLNSLTPGWFDLRPLGRVPEPLAAGAEIAYALRWRGLPLRWTSRIVDWQPPHQLTYEQARGPFLWFRHEHLFAAVADGTRIVDRVRFRGPAGTALDRRLLRPELERIFRHRARVARTLLGPRAARREPLAAATLAAGAQAPQSG